jgi:polysaccharide export outer membrane protein
MVLLAGCVLAPGMRMDQGAVDDRTRGAPPAEAGVIEITPQLLVKLAQDRTAHPPPPAKDPLAEQAATYEYRVAPHDVLTVTVWDHPELTIPAGEFRSPEATGYTVTADGTMFFPHVGVIRVAGMTLPEVRKALADRLTKFVTNPQLDVRVASFRGKKVHVTGEVKEPASMPITDVPLRVQDAIAFARGLGPEAEPRRVTLSREGRTYFLDLQALYEQGDLSQNWLLQDGDVINVPDRTVNKVYVLGEVKRPSSRLMVKGRMNLAEAIGDAEGFDPLTSNPGAVFVVRGPYERTKVYHLDAVSPDALILASRFSLEPQDIVFVAATNLTTWNRVIAQILPTIQALWFTVDTVKRTEDVRVISGP